MQAIGRYTTGRWGKNQRSKYLRQLNARFAWLAENSRLGRNRPDINDKYFCFPEGEHLIFYRIDGDMIEIIAIPHQLMDTQAHLGAQ
jgi:toxin ParE1/3/4